MQLLGYAEWRCPGNFTRQAWHKLTDDKKAALNDAILAAIKSHQEEQ